MTTTNPIKSMRVPGKIWPEIHSAGDEQVFYKPWEIALTAKETRMPKNYDPWQTGKDMLAQEAKLHTRASSQEHPHPNIQIAYGLGNYGPEEDGLQHALKLQKVQGKRLAQLLEWGEEEAIQQTAIKILAEIANAVQHCHDKGIVHCGLNPYNIMIETTGTGKQEKPTGKYILTNFSLAHEIADCKQTPAGIQEPERGFGAPEYFKGEALTTFADTYDFSRLLYIALTGTFPKKGATTKELEEHTDLLGGEIADIIVHGQHEKPMHRPPFIDLRDALNNYAAIIIRAEQAILAKE